MNKGTQMRFGQDESIAWFHYTLFMFVKNRGRASYNPTKLSCEARIVGM